MQPLTIDQRKLAGALALLGAAAAVVTGAALSCRKRRVYLAHRGNPPDDLLARTRKHDDQVLRGEVEHAHSY